jgi:hypothetical protein
MQVISTHYVCLGSLCKSLEIELGWLQNNDVKEELFHILVCSNTFGGENLFHVQWYNIFLD